MISVLPWRARGTPASHHGPLAAPKHHPGQDATALNLPAWRRGWWDRVTLPGVQAALAVPGMWDPLLAKGWVMGSHLPCEGCRAETLKGWAWPV